MGTNGLLKAILNRRQALIIVALMNALYAFSYFQRVAIPGTIFDELQSDLHLSSASVALLGGIFLYAYGAMQIFSGALVDRFGPAMVILSGGVLLSVGSILFPLSGNISMLYSVRLLVGIGGSIMFLAIVKELDLRFSDKNFSALLSASLLAGYAGGLLGTRPFEIVVRTFDWRPALLIIGFACAVTVVLAAVSMRKSLAPGGCRSGASTLPALKRIFRNCSAYPVILSSTIVFGNYFLMQAIIGKKVLEDCCGLTSGAAASATFMMMLASMGAAVFSGFFSRLIGNRRKPILITSTIMSVLAPCLGIMVLNGASHLIIPCYILFGISAGGSPIFTSSMKELNEPEYVGTSVGLLNGIVYLSIAGFVTLSGLVLDRFASHAVVTTTAIRYPAEAYQAIMYVCLGLAIVAFISGLLIRETSGVNVWTADKVQNIAEDFSVAG